MDFLSLIGRSTDLFSIDLLNHEVDLSGMIKNAKFLIIGAAGSIGQAVTYEIFKRNPAVIHAVDINENNMVELVRQIRSTIGYNNVDFRTFCLDCGSVEFEAFFNAEGKYDYILNLSALKHVRNEKDPYTLMRMVRVNILNTIKTLEMANKLKVKKYFCVSTDKATNPVNMMGASKSIMEMFLMRESASQNISTARFANVAFSDGSLLYGFNQRLLKCQPLSAPNDIRRYFVTPKESGEICMFSAILGKNQEIYFPKLNEKLHLIKFSDIAKRFLIAKGYEPFECSSENEARERAKELILKKQWPCYFFKSDTTGEKSIEEFHTKEEKVDYDQYDGLGIIQNQLDFDIIKLKEFQDDIKYLLKQSTWTKSQILTIFNKVLPEFSHIEKGKYLDQRM